MNIDYILQAHGIISGKSKDKIPPPSISNFEGMGDDKKVILTWTNPVDTDFVGVRIMRKQGGFPTGIKDGVMVYTGGGTTYTDVGLINEVKYYYRAFTYDWDNNYNEETTTQRVIAEPADKDDKTGSPGSAKLIAGDMNAGFFGVVPASELFTGAEISSECGITQGTLQFNDVGWLKFASDGKTKFKSQKTYRHSISWDHIDSKGAVNGSKIVEKNGIRYKVTLMKGGNGNASDMVAGPKSSEWNKLMLPIHIKAKDQSWAYPANVTTPTAYWGIDFTDADLQTHYDHGNGAYQWCREVYYDNASGRVLRGYYGVSYSYDYASSSTFSSIGWSPVLEVIS